MGNRITFRGLRRRAARLEPRPRILIVCEGTKTEPTYFEGLKNEEVVRLVEIVVEDSGGVPKTLVKRAALLKRDAEKRAKHSQDNTLRFDEVWCVFDIDAHPHLDEAKQQARDNGIRLAISNPCFELWILLHFQEQTGHIERNHAQRACRRHLNQFKKAVAYADLRDTYEEALARAAALDKRQERNGQPGANPSTWVYKLTERLRDLSRAEVLRKLVKRG
jgi:hypothetical protein